MKNPEYLKKLLNLYLHFFMVPIMTEFMQNEEKIIEGIVNFIREEVNNSHSKGVVIGLSGGIDSAVVAYLSVLAVGKENVSLIHIPENELDTIHTEDAKLIAKELGVELKIFDISEVLDSIIKLLPELKDNKLAKGNLKARNRTVILYSIANIENRLVLGPSNKSEIKIGYGTKYGDLAADLWPIAEIYKTEVYKIAEKLGVNRKIIEKSPTAGLWANQTDEEEIGISYYKLDKLLVGLEKKMNIDILLEKIQISKNQLQKIQKMISSSIHKQKMPKKYEKIKRVNSSEV